MARFTYSTAFALATLAFRGLAGPLPQVSQGTLAFANEDAPNTPVVVAGDFEQPTVSSEESGQVAATTVVVEIVEVTEAAESTGPTTFEAVIVEATPTATRIPGIDPIADAWAAYLEEIDGAGVQNCVTVGFSDDNTPIKMCFSPVGDDIDADTLAAFTSGSLFDGLSIIPRPIPDEICTNENPIGAIYERPEYEAFLSAFSDHLKQTGIGAGNSALTSQEILDFVGNSCSMFNQTNPDVDFETGVKVSNSSCFTTEGWVEEYLGNEIETVHYGNWNQTYSLNNTTPLIRQTQRGFFKKLTYTKMDLCLENEFEAISGKLGVVDLDDFKYLDDDDVKACWKKPKHATTVDGVTTVYYTEPATEVVVTSDSYYTTTVTDNDTGDVVTVTYDDISMVTADATTLYITGTDEVPGPTTTVYIDDGNDDDDVFVTVTDASEAIVTVEAVTSIIATATVETFTTITVPSNGTLSAITATATANPVGLQPGDLVFNPVASTDGTDDGTATDLSGEALKEVVVESQDVNVIVYLPADSSDVVTLSTSTAEPVALTTAVVPTGVSIAVVYVSATSTSAGAPTVTPSEIPQESDELALWGQNAFAQWLSSAVQYVRR